MSECKGIEGSGKDGGSFIRFHYSHFQISIQTTNISEIPHIFVFFTTFALTMNTNENITSKTELQILAAAERLFVEKGFKSTSTTDIAKEAGCNQALVHYYYRTKENLFNLIFDAKFEDVLDFLGRSIHDNSDIFQNIRSIITTYFDYLSENPRIPYFIFNELSDSPARRRHIREVFLTSSKGQDVFTRIYGLIESAVSRGQIRRIDPMDLILDGLSLVISTFVTAPIFVDLLGREPETMREFLYYRREEIITLLTQGMKPVNAI